MTNIYGEPRVEMDQLGSECDSFSSLESEIDVEEWATRAGVQISASSRASSSIKSAVDTPRQSVEVYRELRNAVVKEKYLGPKKLREEQERLENKDRRREPAPPKEVDDGGSSSDSDNDSIGEDNCTSNRFKKTVSHIVEIADEDLKVVIFDHIQYKKVHLAKCYIQHIKNLELIIAGKERQRVTHTWDDKAIDLEFAKVYGPVNTKHPKYKPIRDIFRTQRMNFLIDLGEREKEFIRCLSRAPKVLSPREFGADSLEKIRTQMENAIMSLPEATIDINPYTSKMDFFCLPRNHYTVSVYRVKAVELDHLVEFNLEDNEFSMEGYNPALCDVGLLYPKKVVGDHRRRDYLEGVDKMTIRTKRWDERLLKIKEKFHEYYPHGVESKLFFEKYRSDNGLKADDKILGKYSDDEAPFQLSDVFYPKVIGEGEDKRIILFPSVLKGLIIEPEEMLLRFLRRVRFMLEDEQFVKLDELKEKYELYFGHSSFDPLNWGFNRIEDFINYMCKHFPDETGDVKVVSEEYKAAFEEAEASTANEEKAGAGAGESDNANTKKQSYEINLDPDNFDYEDDEDEEDQWFDYVETLPSKFFFNSH